MFCEVVVKILLATLRKSLYEIFWQRKTEQIVKNVNFYDNLMEAWKLNESPDYKA